MGKRDPAGTSRAPAKLNYRESLGYFQVSLTPQVARALPDALGLGNGYLNFTTRNFDLRLTNDAQVLASLKPAGTSFDFLPFDYLTLRSRNGQYHWGDITARYRDDNTSDWIFADSSKSRHRVTALHTKSLASSNMSPTLPESPLNISREWLDYEGDVALRFTLQNTASSAVELGAVGFPAEFNSIFTNREASDAQRLCSLSDPYIGMDAGHIRVAPLRGTGPALVVTPLGDTPLEAYRNLAEKQYEDTWYGSQTFEGFYEWTVLTKAWAEQEWASNGATPWNPPSSRMLQPDERIQFGVRFSVSWDGVRGFDDTVRSTGTPVAVGAPGFIIPRDEPARLWLRADSAISHISAEPVSSLSVKHVGEGEYAVTPSSGAWGRARLTVEYKDGKTQTIHYYVTKSSTQAVADLGHFLTTEQWFNDTTDPFGRAPSVLTYDHEVKSVVTQDSRAWVAGLSDEAGAGSYLSAFVKQGIQPNADEISRLEEFVDRVLWKTIQTSDYGVRKSIFFYEPTEVPGYEYHSDVDWSSWTSWSKNASYAVDRAYNYVHVAAAYWSFYRAGRAYSDLLERHTWDWYLNQAYRTVMRGMKSDVGYNRVGLMGETVFGQILADLKREEQTTKATSLASHMKSRASQWDSEEVPFGSEMAWDSTGQEGVYFWAKYFGFGKTASKSLNSVLGYMPAVPHWGWNGNARRYWDNIYSGKLGRIERQIHHYGSALNALVLLSGFQSNTSDTYLLRTGYGGTWGPLSSIHEDGFAAASFHSWPDTLRWDGYSGDYGPGFLGLALGSGTYVARDPRLGVVAYGGVLEEGDGVRVRTTDAVRRRVFLGELYVLLSVDAGVIETVGYSNDGTIDVVLGQLEGVPKAKQAVLWIEDTGRQTNYTVTMPRVKRHRGGWAVPLDSSSVSIQLRPAS
ncbi:hypothetical protein B0T10DRAFT_530847 [Thelonectria olida]|uniref:Glycoside hydrolase family 43 protein n=1 Tax=Thelonectria olida TaxID=1576542 RepID=A0A9P8VZS6_9HYPO|nr:hypothetical protein B0T10DRAFT_530847 [Thelonectria olida]